MVHPQIPLPSLGILPGNNPRGNPRWWDTPPVMGQSWWVESMSSLPNKQKIIFTHIHSCTAQERPGKREKEQVLENDGKSGTPQETLWHFGATVLFQSFYNIPVVRVQFLEQPENHFKATWRNIFEKKKDTATSWRTRLQHVFSKDSTFLWTFVCPHLI